MKTIVNLILKALTQSERRTMDFKSLIKRFLSGVAVGLLGALLAWFYSAFANVSIPLEQGLLGILFLTISCGTIGSITDLEKLLKIFPFY